jgi:hypothetical protein
MKIHKLFFILSLAVLLVTEIFGQAAVDIPITFVHNINNQIVLNFGLDLTATDGMDPWLGEAPPPPLPPPFPLAIWVLPPYPEWSLRDYRAPGNPPAFPFTGTVQYNIFFPYQVYYPITISWNLPPEIALTSTIQDIWGGGIINKTFTGSDSLVVTDSTIGQLYVFVDYDNIIPVELTSFNAEVSGQVVLLNWTTATETNNSGFEILRKAQNDSEWETIGFVPGFGTTTEPKSYSFIDENITTGVYKYRLKQLDFDGTFEYSNEIEVEVDFTPKEFVLYQNYPNPFNPNTTIKYEIPNVETTQRVVFTTLKVYDVLGNEVATLVNEEKQSGVYEVEFDASSLASGMYLYKLQAGAFIQSKKMILTK